MKPDPLYRVSLYTATSLVIANMVGTGVFTSLGFQVLDISSGFALLSLWIVGGLFALSGALSYAELSAALPRSGGEFHFLSRIYHPALGTMAGWVSATVGFSAPIALGAMAFAVYAKPLAPQVSPVLLSSALVALITLVHLRGLASTSRLQNIFTTLKVALIMCFIGAGLAHAQPQTMTFTPSAPDWPILVSAPFGVSLIYVMYAYSGWNAATYIINEIKDPARCLPRALIGGTLLVTVLYVGLNWVFLRCAPVSELRGQLDVGFVVARHLFGPTGSLWVSGLIALMLVSLVSAMVWAGPRVTQVMGEDLPALRWLSHGSSRGVPARAIVAQWVLVQVLIVTASYQQIMMATQWVLAFCSFLTVMGVFVLRWREPELPRPFRVWGYPITPLLFALIAVFTMGYVLKEHPLESGLGLGWMLLGLVLYGVTSRKSARTD